jgi:hypothetical protein
MTSTVVRKPCFWASLAYKHESKLELGQRALNSALTNQTLEISFIPPVFIHMLHKYLVCRAIFCWKEGPQRLVQNVCTAVMSRFERLILLLFALRNTKVDYSFSVLEIISLRITLEILNC